MSSKKMRNVRIETDESEPDLTPQRYRVIDMESGEKIENLKGFTIAVRAGEITEVLVETFPEGWDLKVEEEATITEEDHFVDRRGQTWISGPAMARMIKEKGIRCSRGEKGAVSCEFSDELLQVWESTEKSGPDQGRKKETASHG